MRYYFKFLLSSFFLIAAPLFAVAQLSYFPIDTLKAADIRLEQIDLHYGNTYYFAKTISSDSVFFVLPGYLPKGYYEAYYDDDTNQLALTYYNFGKRSYTQQYYKDGSMKSDSEYDRYGAMQGLHILYNRDGDEVWHADYWHGHIEIKYSFEYLEVFNYSTELINKHKAWGCYEFSPTPMRERHEQIDLRANGSFSFHNFNADCNCRRHSEGHWELKDKLLHLKIDNKDVWGGKENKVFAIITNQRMKKAQLIEVLPWGLNWYGSEFWLCKKCDCIQLSADK